MIQPQKVGAKPLIDAYITNLCRGIKILRWSDLEIPVDRSQTPADEISDVAAHLTLEILPGFFASRDDTR
jgi:hypothetical protein